MLTLVLLHHRNNFLSYLNCTIIHNKSNIRGAFIDVLHIIKQTRWVKIRIIDGMNKFNYSNQSTSKKFEALFIEYRNSTHLSKIPDFCDCKNETSLKLSSF